MGTIVSFVQLPPWQRPAPSKLRKKRRPLSLMNSAWFKRHGSFRAIVNKTGGLILEHDQLRSVPESLLRDLVRAKVVYYGGSPDALEQIRMGYYDSQKPQGWVDIEHTLNLWLKDGRKANQLEFVNHPGFYVPREVATIALVLVVKADPEEDDGNEYEIELCRIEDVRDERRSKSFEKSRVGG